MKRHGWGGGGGDTVFCVDVASCQEGNVPELEITVLTNIFFFPLVNLLLWGFSCMYDS